MIPNDSGLVPLGRAVLIRAYEPKKADSVIIIPTASQERHIALDQRAVVVAVGPSAWPDEPPRAKPGDKVLVAKSSGHVARGTKDGELYRFINDRDIFAAIVEEKQNG